MQSKLKVLVLCEYSGIVRDAFTSAGHIATSCDIIPSSSPGRHIIGDALQVAETFTADLIIAHPPCTYLSKAALHLCKDNPERQSKRDIAVAFAISISQLNCPRIVIENPPGYLSSGWRQYDQCVRPYFFGDPYDKAICLWFKNVCPLIATEYSTERKSVFNHTNGRMSQALKSKIHSRFFKKTAAAMAAQWS